MNQSSRPDTYHQLISQHRSAVPDFSIREFLHKYLYLLPWLLLSAAIAVAIAYGRLRYINPIYSASGKVLIKTEKTPGTSATDKLGDVINTTVNTRTMDDQIELIKSSSLARLVARNHDLQFRYHFKGKVRDRLIHNPSSPIRLEIIALADSSRPFAFEVHAKDNQVFSIDNQETRFAFGRPFTTPAGTFILHKRMADLGTLKEYSCAWMPEIDAARMLASGIQVAVTTKGGNVLSFVYNAEHPLVAKDVVNGFLTAYQEFSLSDKRESAVSALVFIEDQLEQAKSDLSNIELEMQSFRERNKSVALPDQSSAYFRKLQESGQGIADQSVKVKLIDFMINYITDPKNAERSIPLTSAVTDGALVTLISQFNREQVQREIALQTIPKSNPIIREMDVALSKVRNDILTALAQMKDSYLSVQTSLQDAELQGNRELREMPGKERQLLDIVRRQKVMEELYSTLLQRKVQTSISTASTLSNIQVLEPGFSSGAPVSPRSRSVYLTALLIGLIIPIGLAFFFEQINDKIRSKRDLELLTAVPILGEVARSTASSSLVVGPKERTFIAEQFRILRTNLQFIFGAHQGSRVLLITSTSSGEGKSFIATNMAAVMAISGKKTMLIEFDIRKPAILKGLSMQANRKEGLTSVLIGISEWRNAVVSIPTIENLHVLPCGPMAPNPAELLLSNRLSDLITELRKEYDAIIIDSPPVGMVSDGFVLGKMADATLYVVRHNHTLRKQVQLLQSIYEQQKLPGLSLVINDVKSHAGYAPYYGQGGYGQAYTYGTKRDFQHYFEVEESRPWWRWKR